MSSARNGDPLVGQVLDERYEIVRRLARGGMATVYVATDLRLSRTVAVKVMNEGLGDDDEFVARFDAEARAAAHLSHAHVVSVFDQGRDLGRPYIVMEYVEGCTLRQLITREAPMDPLRALELLEPVVCALAAAHAAGLIHRDVKPENVLISDRGQIKVADFGLARAVTAATNTGTQGLVIGTVSYIAPELVTRGHADPRSDVYSTGIVLYEMLTGHKPHTGDTPIQVAYAHVHSEVTPPSLELSTSWRDSRHGIPPYLDALVVTAAARRREDRPADAGVLLAHLRLAREALARGVADDPALTQRMRRTTVDVATTVTERVPSLVGAAHALDPRPREVRFTPSTPVSPTSEASADGVPYYSSGRGPATPLSPVTRTLPTVSESPPPPRHRPPRRRGRLLATLLLLLALVGGVSAGGWYLLEGRWTSAPPLARLNQTDAAAAASAAGLTVDFEREYSEDVPVGLVTRTDPDAGGRVLAGGTLQAYVSRGPERYPVPTLTGLTRDKALAAIAAGFLAVGQVTEAHHDTVEAGLVLRQSLKAGAPVRKASTVDLVVSKGPAPVAVADHTGKKFSTARATLEKAGLTVTSSEENSATVAKGLVISQTPGAGELRRGDSVRFVVSKGPVMVAVPSVRGIGADQAIEKLKKAGFDVRTQRMVGGAFGLAWGTDPAAGKSAPQGSTVTLYLV